jgi:hypothetical protein
VPACNGFTTLLALTALAAAPPPALPLPFPPGCAAPTGAAAFNGGPALLPPDPAAPPAPLLKLFDAPVVFQNLLELQRRLFNRRPRRRALRLLLLLVFPEILLAQQQALLQRVAFFLEAAARKQAGLGSSSFGHRPNMITEIKNLLVAPNGAPLFGDQTYHRINQLGMQTYLDQCTEFMGREGYSHLAQVLLLAGDFEMILRYPNIRESLANQVKLNSRQFKSFIADAANYWPPRKMKELSETNFEKELLLDAPTEAELAAQDQAEKERLMVEEAERMAREKETQQMAREEEEARLRIVQEARIKAEQEAREKAEQEAEKKAEQEANEKAEQEANEKAVKEANEKAAKEARIKAEKEAKEKADQEARIKAEKEQNRLETDRLANEIRSANGNESPIGPSLGAQKTKASSPITEKKASSNHTYFVIILSCLGSLIVLVIASVGGLYILNA